MSSRLSGKTMNSWNPSMATAAISAGASRSKNWATPPGEFRDSISNPWRRNSSSSMADWALMGSCPRFCPLLMMVWFSAETT